MTDYRKTEIIISERTFTGMVISSIEVYKRECLGVLLGIQSNRKIVVEHAIPLQAVAERTFSMVRANWKKEMKVKEAIPKLMHLDCLGYFHSHPQWGEIKGTAELSQADKESMDAKDIEIVVAINNKKYHKAWKAKNGELFGSICDYSMRLAGFYKRVNGQVKQLDLVCPYAVGCDNAFNEGNH